MYRTIKQYSKLFMLTGAVSSLMAFNFKKNNPLKLEDGSDDVQISKSKIFFHTYLSEFTKLKIFSGTNSQLLSREIAAHLDISLGRIQQTKFSDGEHNIKILDDINGHKVFFISSICPPNIQDNLMEILLTISALKRAGANKVVCVIPYMGYSRQSEHTNNNKLNQRGQMFAPVVCDLLKQMGCDQVITINFHKDELVGFFSPEIPCMNINVNDLVIPYMTNKSLNDPILISSSSNSKNVKQVLNLIETFKLFQNNYGFGMFNQISPKKFEYVGDQISKRDVLVISDMIDTGRNLRLFSDILKSKGAGKIYYFAPHALLTGEALENISKSQVDEVLVTNTLEEHQPSQNLIKYLSVGKLLAEIISIIHEDMPINQYRERKSLAKYMNSTMFNIVNYQ